MKKNDFCAQPTVLIVDDQPDNLDVIVSYLADSGMRLLVATDGEHAIELAQEQIPDIVLLDIMMPGLDGFQVCKALKLDNRTKNVPVIFMSAFSDLGRRLEGFNVGGIDYVVKPIQREEMLARINAHLTICQQQKMLTENNLQLTNLNNELQEQIAKRHKVEQDLHLADERLSTITRRESERCGIDAFVGQSLITRQLVEEVRNIQAAPNTNVLILGESGTGKELISRAVHYSSSRRTKPFVAVNCSAIPTELADAELFGHTKGAFTGATNERNGYFVQADGGTLFLDEIGDMPLVLQAKLLRVLEDGIVTPVGGKKSRKVDVRVVSATNMDLREKVKAKTFRQDLFYRLASYQISLPALRQRKGDIELLVEHFLDLLCEQMGREVPLITSGALHAMRQYHFPGNVRELKNLIEYALIASRGKPITVDHLHFMEPFSQLPENNIEELIQTNDNAQNTKDKPPESSCKASIISELPCSNSQEEALIAYAKMQGRVDNTSAQNALGIDHGRASYLLKKLHKDGLLNKNGQRRWTYYTAAE